MVQDGNRAEELAHGTKIVPWLPLNGIR